MLLISQLVAVIPSVRKLSLSWSKSREDPRYSLETYNTAPQRSCFLKWVKKYNLYSVLECGLTIYHYSKKTENFCYAVGNGGLQDTILSNGMKDKVATTNTVPCLLILVKLKVTTFRGEIVSRSKSVEVSLVKRLSAAVFTFYHIDMRFQVLWPSKAVKAANKLRSLNMVLKKPKINHLLILVCIFAPCFIHSWQFYCAAAALCSLNLFMPVCKGVLDCPC